MSANVAEYLQDLLAAHPHFKPPDPERTLEVYTRALGDLEDYELRAAVEHHLREGGKFFPNPAEIREIVQQIRPQPPRDWLGPAFELERRAWAGDFQPEEWHAWERELRLGDRTSTADWLAEKRTFFEGYHAAD